MENLAVVAIQINNIKFINRWFRGSYAMPNVGTEGDQAWKALQTHTFRGENNSIVLPL